MNKTLYINNYVQEVYFRLKIEFSATIIILHNNISHIFCLIKINLHISFRKPQQHFSLTTFSLHIQP